MFGWFSKKATKVRVSQQHLNFHKFGKNEELWPSPELALFLADHKGKYSIRYDELTGARWIDFDDKNTAVICRLTFA